MNIFKNERNIWLVLLLGIERTNLFLKAKMTAPACSAALPTIGNKITLMKLTEIPQESDADCLINFKVKKLINCLSLQNLKISS